MDFLVNKDIQNRNGIEYCRKSTEDEERQISYSLQTRIVLGRVLRDPDVFGQVAPVTASRSNAAENFPIAHDMREEFFRRRFSDTSRDADDGEIWKL